MVSFIEVTLEEMVTSKKITTNFNNCNENTIKKWGYFKTPCKINIESPVLNSLYIGIESVLNYP